MMIKQKIIIPAVLAAAIGGVTILGVSAVKAETSTPTNPMTQLVQMISQKFGLNQTQVQAVVDQFQTQRQEERQKLMLERQKAKLDQLVADGKLTSAQAQAWLDKFTSRQTEMETWMKSQGIDPSVIRMGMGGERGMGGHW